MTSKNPVVNILGDVSRRLSRIQMAKTSSQHGIIESVLVVNNTVYAIIRKTRVEFDEVSHDYYPLFNNYLKSPEDSLTPTELLIPLINIDMSNNTLDPKDLIGRYAVVEVTDGNRAIKAEYVGSVGDPSQGPLKISQTVLYNARLLAGATARLATADSESRKYLAEVAKLEDEALELLDQKLSEWKGKVVTVEGDANYHKTTDATQEFELKIKSEDFLKEANKTKMKTRNCHLPISIFSAR